MYIHRINSSYHQITKRKKKNKVYVGIGYKTQLILKETTVY